MITVDCSVRATMCVLVLCLLTGCAATPQPPSSEQIKTADETCTKQHWTTYLGMAWCIEEVERPLWAAYDENLVPVYNHLADSRRQLAAQTDNHLITVQQYAQQFGIERAKFARYIAEYRVAVARADQEVADERYDSEMQPIDDFLNALFGTVAIVAQTKANADGAAAESLAATRPHIETTSCQRVFDTVQCTTTRGP
jgi:hypothetical protein